MQNNIMDGGVSRYKQSVDIIYRWPLPHALAQLEFHSPPLLPFLLLRPRPLAGAVWSTQLLAFLLRLHNCVVIIPQVSRHQTASGKGTIFCRHHERMGSKVTPLKRALCAPHPNLFERNLESIEAARGRKPLGPKPKWIVAASC